MGHKHIWQSSQDMEETNKANSATVLESAPMRWKVILAGADCDHRAKVPTDPKEEKDRVCELIIMRGGRIINQKNIEC